MLVVASVSWPCVFLKLSMLVLMCLWGQISPQILQKTMDLFMKDLDAHKENRLDTSGVKELASIGTWGAHANNVWRDFKNHLPALRLPQLHVFRIPFVHSVFGYMYKPTSMLLPHELFAAMFKSYPAMFKQCVYPGRDTCMRFWNSVKGGLHFRNHPVRYAQDLGKCIPLRFHGDGTPSCGIGKSWAKLVDVFSVSSMLVYGSSLLYNFMIWLVHQSLICTKPGHHTMNAFWKRFAWSCEALAAGKWPTHDCNGTPIRSALAGKSLMGGLCCYIWACIGDLDYWVKTLELPNSNSNEPCALCPANCTTHPWWDFRASASWAACVYTASAWAGLGWNTCGLFKCPGVSVYSLYPDWMHVKHLGIDKVLLGSVLWMLVHWILPGEDPFAKLKTVWTNILRIYEEDNVPDRYGAIKMTMFTTKSTPKLKGKAHEVKSLGPVLLKVFRVFMNVELALHRKIELLLRWSAHMDAIIDDNAALFALPEHDACDLIATGSGYLTVFYELSLVFKDTDVGLFSVTSKAHYLMHICILSRHVRIS